MSNVYPICGPRPGAMCMRVISSQGVASPQIRDTTRSYREHDLGPMTDATGCVGLALGENHTAGSIATVTFWQTQANMDATEQLATRAHERADGTLGRPKVVHRDRYQVALTSDLQRPACGRVPWMRVIRIHHLPIGELASIIDRHRDEIVGLLEQALGFEGGVLGTNHQTGSLTIVSFWSQERSMLDADAQAKHTRDQITAAHPDARALIDRFAVALTGNLERLAAAPGAAPARARHRGASR